MPRLLVILLTALAGLAVPAAASAREGFLAVLANGQAVRFADDSVPGLTSPQRIAGVARGSRIVAVGAGVALDRDGRLYRLSEAARPVATLAAARLQLRGTSFSVIPVPGTQLVRVLSDAGLDLTADLATGTVSPGPGLRLTSGVAIAPAAALLPDGRLAGVDPHRRTLVTETAPGSNLFTEMPLRPRRGEVRLSDPVAFAVANGKGYVTTRLPVAHFPQSELWTVDLTTGAVVGDDGPYFFRQLASLVPVGSVAADRTPPHATILAPGTISYRDLVAPNKVRVRVRCSEGCYVSAASAAGGRVNGGMTAARDMAGVVTIRLPGLRKPVERTIMRRRIGRTASLRAVVRDWSGNKRTVVRSFRVVA
jgi:hypothetical protein